MNDKCITATKVLRKSGHCHAASALRNFSRARSRNPPCFSLLVGSSLRACCRQRRGERLCITRLQLFAVMMCPVWTAQLSGTFNRAERFELRDKLSARSLVEEERLIDVNTSRRYRLENSWTTCESNCLDLDTRAHELVRPRAMPNIRESRSTPRSSSFRLASNVVQSRKRRHALKAQPRRFLHAHAHADAHVRVMMLHAGVPIC